MPLGIVDSLARAYSMIHFHVSKMRKDQLLNGLNDPFWLAFSGPGKLWDRAALKRKAVEQEACTFKMIEAPRAAAGAPVSKS